jgi:nickel-dependent lactate racemase
MPTNPLSIIRAEGAALDADRLAELVAQACPANDFRGLRVLLILPDATRTAPIGLMFRHLHRQLGEVAAAFDILIALGTHMAMSEAAICRRLEISETERASRFGRVQFYNHAWDNPQALRRVGILPAAEIRELSRGLFALDVAVEVNQRLFDYDRIVIVGPVFPHEVVGFSGGNKYLFPGVAGPEVLNFFHWLGAVITTPRIIGNVWTPVRRVVDRAASFVTVPKVCFCLVVDPDGSPAGVFAGTPEAAWAAAVQLSRERHITYKDRPFHTIVSCAPPIYDEIWTGAKCMYKLEPVLADGGELIIHAPHIRDVSFTHGHLIEQVGYHCRDYFLTHWDQFRSYPWGVLAHCAHVYGLGTYENGIETPRARVTLATGIPEDTCRRINLGYRDAAKLRLEDYANREDEGVLLVPKAGEQLFRLKHPPVWARES